MNTPTATHLEILRELIRGGVIWPRDHAVSDDNPRFVLMTASGHRRAVTPSDFNYLHFEKGWIVKGDALFFEYVLNTPSHAFAEAAEALEEAAPSGTLPLIEA